MKKLFLVLLLFLLSCNETNHELSFIEKIKNYENSEELELNYQKIDKSGDTLNVSVYKKSTSGLSKVNATYLNHLLGNWEKTIIVHKNQLFAKELGVAKLIKEDSTSKDEYVLTDKIFEFKNDSIGIERNREIYFFNLSDIDSLKTILTSKKYKVFPVKRIQYNFLKSQFNDYTKNSN